MEANVSGHANADSSFILVSDLTTDVDLSMVANSDASVVSLGSIASVDPIVHDLGVQARIPDFALFHTHTVNQTIARELILLVEIKPYKSRTPESGDQLLKNFRDLSLQVVTQALFALDESSDISEVKVLCVIGWHWRMLGPFRKEQKSTNVSPAAYRKPEDVGVIMLPRMPKGKFNDVVLGNPASAIQDGYTSDYLASLEGAVSEATRALSIKIRNVFTFENGFITGYNEDFKEEWNVMLKEANIVRK